MRLFYSVIKRQLALLSLRWVSVKCITHKKIVKRRRFEVNKLHNVTSSSVRCEQTLISARHSFRFCFFPAGISAPALWLTWVCPHFTDTRKTENKKRKKNLQLSTESHKERRDLGRTYFYSISEMGPAVHAGHFWSCQLNPLYFAVTLASFYGNSLPPC